MYRAMIVLLGILLPTTVLSEDNPLPPVPEGGLMLVMEGACTDDASGVPGYCVMSQDRDGNIYVMFAVDGELVEIRQVVGDSYIVLWSSVTPVVLGELL